MIMSKVVDQPRRSLLIWDYTDQHQHWYHTTPQWIEILHLHVFLLNKSRVHAQWKSAEYDPSNTIYTEVETSCFGLWRQLKLRADKQQPRNLKDLVSAKTGAKV